jgi:hypothetical protein
VRDLVLAVREVAIARRRVKRLVVGRVRQVDDLRAVRPLAERLQRGGGEVGLREEPARCAERIGAVRACELDQIGARIAIIAIQLRGAGRHPALHQAHHAAIDRSTRSRQDRTHHATVAYFGSPCD